MSTLAKRVMIAAAAAWVAGGITFGIWAFASWLATPSPQPTISQDWHDGYSDPWSDLNNGEDGYPWGKYSCVTDWDGQITGIPQSAGFSNGGPSSSVIITYADQDTHSAAGNAWMAGCRAGLAAIEKRYALPK